MLSVLEESVITVNTTMVATQKHSTWSNLYTEIPMAPLSLDPGTLILKDIESLEQKLTDLK